MPELNLEQQRAKDALTKINAESAMGKDTYGNYRSYCEGLPASILMNGLGQALAMLLAKAGDKREKRRLYDAVSLWVAKNVYSNQKDLLENITNNGEQQYIEAHAEALAYLSWLKKFAAAFLEKAERDD